MFYEYEHELKHEEPYFTTEGSLKNSKDFIPYYPYTMQEFFFAQLKKFDRKLTILRTLKFETYAKPYTKKNLIT